MKYIVFDQRLPILFPAWIEHFEMIGKFVGREPTSAGFISFIDNKVYAHGESVSLGITSHFRDSKLIAAFLEVGAYEQSTDD